MLVLLDGTDELIEKNRDIHTILTFLYCGSKTNAYKASVSCFHGKGTYLYMMSFRNVGEIDIFHRWLNIEEPYAILAVLIDAGLLIEDRVARRWFGHGRVSYCLSKTGEKYVEDYLMPILVAMQI